MSKEEEKSPAATEAVATMAGRDVQALTILRQLMP